jgi:site-specific recombinase XerD
MFLRFCAREGWLDERVVSHFDMPKRAHTVIQVFTPEHYTRLVHATEGHPLSLRDKALLAVLFDTGLRAGELCSLTLSSLFLAPGASYVRVAGKGRRERECPLGKKAALALHRYLTRGRPTSTCPGVFLSRDGKPLTPNAIDRVLYRLRDTAGASFFAGVRCSAHSLRHSMAVHFMQQGGDVYVLSRLLGHENVQTTQRYLQAFQARDARMNSRSVLDGL